MTVASTSSPAHNLLSRSQFSGGTARTIRSCDSEIQISVYESPAYFSGAFSRSTWAPRSAPISPTAELKPPAPQSVRVARLQDNVQQLLLGDGVADLHRPAADLLGLRGQTGRGERRTVDAVAPRPAADGDDQVGRTCRLLSAVYRDQADGAAEDERVGEVALVEADGAVDCRDADAVAVVAHTGNDAPHHLERVQHAGRQVLRFHVERAEAKDVRVAHGLGAEASAERIADDAADAGVGAAVRFDRRRPVVRLHLEADVKLVVEAHDAGVVLEDADAPVVRTEQAANFLRGGENRLLEEVVIPAKAPAEPALPGSAGASPSRKSSSRKSMTPLSVLCEQCSDHVCAMVSNSTSVGSRRSSRKWA